MLSDVESHDEHDETKYSPRGRMMAELRTIMCVDVGEIKEKK